MAEGAVMRRMLMLLLALAVLLLAAGTAVAQEEGQDQPAQKPAEDEKQVVKGGTVIVVVHDGKVFVNGQQLAEQPEGEAVTVTVVNGKVYVNGKEIEAKAPLKGIGEHIRRIKQKSSIVLWLVKWLKEIPLPSTPWVIFTVKVFMSSRTMKRQCSITKKRWI